MVNQYVTCKRHKNKCQKHLAVCFTKCKGWDYCKAVAQVWFDAGYTFSRYRKPKGGE